MEEYQSLRHTRWHCKYHVVFIPKRRKKRVFGVLRQHLGEMFHELASHKEAKIVEGHPCQGTRRTIRDDLKRIHLALLSCLNGRVWQVTEPSPDAANRLNAWKVMPPKPILNLD